MTYQFHTDCDPSAFDEFVINSDQNNLFQSSYWAEIKVNWKSFFTSATEDGKIKAAALVLVRPLVLGKTLVYVPRGPIMDYHDPSLVKFMIESLVKFAKENKAADLRFDPAVVLRTYPYEQRKNPPERTNTDIISLLGALNCRHRGFTMHIEDATQPRFSAVMHPAPDYRDHLERKADKRIRTSIHKGVEVLEGPQYVHELAEVMHGTEVRKQVALRSEEYFANMLKVYGDKSTCMITYIDFPKQIAKLEEDIAASKDKLTNGDLGRNQKKIVEQDLSSDTKELEKLQADYKREGKDRVVTSGILAAYNDKRMEQFYMGNHPDYLRLYSSYLLNAKCIDMCVDKGIEICSFGGVEGSLDDGLTLFKSHWLISIEEYIGEFNYVIDPFIYKMFNEFYPWIREKAAKLRGRK